MTKDLALLVGGDQEFQTTQEFLASIDENLQAAMAVGACTGRSAAVVEVERRRSSRITTTDRAGWRALAVGRERDLDRSPSTARLARARVAASAAIAPRSTRVRVGLAGRARSAAPPDGAVGVYAAAERGQAAVAEPRRAAGRSGWPRDGSSSAVELRRTARRLRDQRRRPSASSPPSTTTPSPASATSVDPRVGIDAARRRRARSPRRPGSSASSSKRWDVRITASGPSGSSWSRRRRRDRGAVEGVDHRSVSNVWAKLERSARSPDRRSLDAARTRGRRVEVLGEALDRDRVGVRVQPELRDRGLVDDRRAATTATASAGR